jgi:O-antigen/teichoic acid export membrane protein
LPSVSAINALFLGVLFSYLLSVLWLSKFKITLPPIRFRGKTRWRKIFLKYGLPLSLWMMFSPTTNGVDRYIIEYSLGTIMLAKYTAVFDIVFKVFSSIAIPFNNIVQPMLIQNYNEKNYTEYKKTVNKALVYLTLIFLLFISGVILLQDFIICRYLGFCEQSLLLSKLIIPLAFSSYIWQIAILLQKNMEVSNKTFEITIYMLIVVVIIVLLGIIFGPSYGLLASAYISLFTASVYLLLVIYGTKKHFKL